VNILKAIRNIFFAIALIFINIFLAIGLWQGIVIYSDLKNSVNWPKTEAIVSASKIIKSSGKLGDTYCPEWDYYYNVDGKKYNSTRTAFGSYKCHSYRKYAERELNEHPIGSKVFATYDPKNPTKAALKLSTGYPFNVLILFCMLVVLEVVVPIVIFKVYKYQTHQT
jgi:Protein of unknown function (DUF3592)